MPELEIHYSGSGWAALYVDGQLAPDTVGDSRYAKEEALRRCGVTAVDDDAFLRGAKDRSNVAQNLDEVAAYRDKRAATLRAAEEKIAQARKLLMEAKALDPDGRLDHGVTV